MKSLAQTVTETLWFQSLIAVAKQCWPFTVVHAAFNLNTNTVPSKGHLPVLSVHIFYIIKANFICFVKAKPLWLLVSLFCYYLPDFFHIQCVWQQKINKPGKSPSGSPLFFSHKVEKTRAMLTNPALRVSRAQCRVEVTFRSMSLNGNVTDSGAPVTLGSTQPEWASRAFRPLEASSVCWHLRLAHSHTLPPTVHCTQYQSCLGDLINP